MMIRIPTFDSNTTPICGYGIDLWGASSKIGTVPQRLAVPWPIYYKGNLNSPASSFSLSPGSAVFRYKWSSVHRRAPAYVNTRKLKLSNCSNMESTNQQVEKSGKQQRGNLPLTLYKYRIRQSSNCTSLVLAALLNTYIFYLTQVVSLPPSAAKPSLITWDKNSVELQIRVQDT